MDAEPLVSRTERLSVKLSWSAAASFIAFRARQTERPALIEWRGADSHLAEENRKNLLEDDKRLIELTADIVAAHVGGNTVAVGDVAGLVASVHRALSELVAAPAAPEVNHQPAVTIRSSVKPDHLVCLACGKRQTTLKRHLAMAHRLSPAEYPGRYGLKSDYPLVAPDYSDRRRGIAQASGLGRKAAECSKKGSQRPAKAEEASVRSE
jgi:predicted transcriptional regulator